MNYVDVSLFLERYGVEKIYQMSLMQFIEERKVKYV